MMTKSTYQFMTPKQVGAFWRAFAAACCELELSTSAEKESYRKQVLREEAHVTSLKLVNRTTDYDKIMARLKSDAGEDAAAIEYAMGTDYRIQAMIKVSASQIMQLTGESESKAAVYVAGVAEQAKIPVSVTGDLVFIDVPRHRAKSVFLMLETHRRRLLRPYCSAAKSFNMRAVYRPVPPHGMQISYADYSDPKHLRINFK